MTPQTTTHHLSALMSHLAATHGWTPDRIISNAATRQYMTAVGLKQASLRVTVCRTTKATYIWPEYQSEGRNAVANCIGHIAATATEAEALAALDAFVVKLDAAVSRTYAARLLRMREAEPA